MNTVKEILKRNGLSLKQFAEEIGISAPTVSKYAKCFENGEDIKKLKYASLFKLLFRDSKISKTNFNSTLSAFKESLKIKEVVAEVLDEKKESNQEQEFDFPTIEEVESKYKKDINLNNQLCNAVILLSKHINKTDDINDWKDKLERLHGAEKDLNHILEFTRIESQSELQSWATEYREILTQRRIIKTRIAIYEALNSLKGFDDINYAPLNFALGNGGVYKPRTYNLDYFTKGEKVDISDLKHKVDSNGSVNYSQEYQDYIDELHSTPINSKFFAKSIQFIEGSLNDLKNKIEQQSAKYSKFKVDGSLLRCYN